MLEHRYTRLSFNNTNKRFLLRIQRQENNVDMPKANKDQATKQTVDEIIGLRVRALRKGRGWTQQDLSEKLEITAVHVSDLERGARRWHAQRISEVASALDVSSALLQDPSIPIDQLPLLGKLLEKLSLLPEDRLETIDQVIDGFLERAL